jgi:hypothetical protein
LINRGATIREKARFSKRAVIARHFRVAQDSLDLKALFAFAH